MKNVLNFWQKQTLPCENQCRDYPLHSAQGRTRAGPFDLLLAKNSHLFEQLYRITGMGQVKLISGEKAIESGWTVLAGAGGTGENKTAVPEQGFRVWPMSVRDGSASTSGSQILQ